MGTNAREVVRVENKLTIDGALLILEVRRTDALVYADGISPNTEASNPEVEMCIRGDVLFAGQGDPPTQMIARRAIPAVSRAGSMLEYRLSRSSFPLLLGVGVVAPPTGGALLVGAAGCRPASPRGGPMTHLVSLRARLSLPFAGRGRGALNWAPT